MASSGVRVEEVVEEVRRVRELVEDLYEKVGPVLRLLDELAHLMASEEFFKVVTPALAAVSALERADANAVNAATYASLLCLFRGFERVVRDGVPEVGGLTGLLKMLNDPDVRRGLGLLFVLAKSLGSCVEGEVARFRG